MQTEQINTNTRKQVYTPEIIKAITDRYTAGVTPEEIGSEFSIPVRSVVAKLSSLGIYRKKVYLSKSGQPPRKKESYVESIANMLDRPVEVLESLEKVNKIVLRLIEEALLAKK